MNYPPKLYPYLYQGIQAQPYADFIFFMQDNVSISASICLHYSIALVQKTALKALSAKSSSQRISNKELHSGDYIASHYNRLLAVPLSSGYTYVLCAPITCFYISHIIGSLWGRDAHTKISCMPCLKVRIHCMNAIPEAPGNRWYVRWGDSTIQSLC